MSGLYLLLLFSIWILVGWAIYKLWHAINNQIQGLSIASICIGLVFFAIWFGWPFWEMFGKKMYWDAKVRELCAIDGGVKVYERVLLPSKIFDKYGNVGIVNKRHAKPSDGYYFQTENVYLRKDNPKIIRSVTQIIRRDDNKNLGESIRYGRSGGDLPGPWHPSSYGCPPIEELRLESSIFMKGLE